MDAFLRAQQQIDSATELAQIGGICQAIADSYAFPHFLFGFRFPLSLEKPYQLIFSSYPKAWRKHYDDNNFFAIDPLVKRALHSSIPFTWDELSRDTPAAAKLFDDASAFGLSYGIAAPMHGSNGSGALFTMAGPNPLPSQERLIQVLLETLWLTTQLHDRLRSILVQGITVKLGRLTPRERQCLKLAASGLSAGSISAKIDISERTVIYYLGRAEEKLGVRTRQHAIARAIFLGELEPDCYPALISQSQKFVEVGT